MKYEKQVILGIISSIIIYAAFLIFSDISKILEFLPKFNLLYLPIILIFVTSGWFFLFLRWNLLLKNSKIKIPIKENLKIYFSGYALAVTPGNLGELIKSQLLKNKFNIQYKTSTTLVFVERLYDLTGAIFVSIIGIWFLTDAVIIFFIALIFIFSIFAIIHSKKLFSFVLNKLAKISFLSKFTESLSKSYEIIYSSTRGKTLIFSLVFSCSFWLVESIGVYFVILSFNMENLDFFNIVSTYTSSLIVGAASLVPGGIGIAEGSMAGLLFFQGVKLSDAVIVAIFIRIFTLWYSVIVGMVIMKISGGLIKRN